MENRSMKDIYRHLGLFGIVILCSLILGSCENNPTKKNTVDRGTNGDPNAANMSTDSDGDIGTNTVVDSDADIEGDIHMDDGSDEETDSQNDGVDTHLIYDSDTHLHINDTDVNAPDTNADTGDEISNSDTDMNAPDTNVDTGEEHIANSECSVPKDELSGIGRCTQVAPPDAFEPEVQWSWDLPGEKAVGAFTPLVANLTDDNDDSRIDLCDIPDVVAVISKKGGSARHIYVLDGETGKEHYHIDYSVYATPALGDIDGDGQVEIVAIGDKDGTRLIAFEHDGTFKWSGNDTETVRGALAVSLADIDEDGDVEIITHDSVYDHEGNLLWTVPISLMYNLPTAANLDGDPGLEIVFGAEAYYADGSVYYKNDDLNGNDPVFPQIADLDNDGLPEVLVTIYQQFAVLEHDGTTKRLTDIPLEDDMGKSWVLSPPSIHDFDGDKEAEFILTGDPYLFMFERDSSMLWRLPTSSVNTRFRASTAFDFLGDGSAEAIFPTDTAISVIDFNGETVFDFPQVGGPVVSYPVVADVDNDGAAEIVAVSYGEGDTPPVQVIRDVEDRWIRTRRIWNQHTYHVTNIKEDGTIPRVEPKSWEVFNTFRTNVQIENGIPCHTVPII